MEDCSPSVGEVSWFVFIAITFPQSCLQSMQMYLSHGSGIQGGARLTEGDLPRVPRLHKSFAYQRASNNPQGAHQLPQQMLSLALDPAFPLSYFHDPCYVRVWVSNRITHQSKKEFESS